MRSEASKEVPIFPTKVLLATDGSEDAAVAARIALEIADKAGSELHVAYVEYLSAAIDYEMERITGANIEDKRKRAERFLAAQTEPIADAGGGVTEAHLRMGSPDQEIIVLAEEIGAGLIVLGSRGRAGLRRALMGSVSDSVVRYAHCPVLVVRRKEGRQVAERSAEDMDTPPRNGDSGRETGLSEGTLVVRLGEAPDDLVSNSIGVLDDLARSGLPVPEGVVLTRKAHVEFLRASGLMWHIREALGGGRAVARRRALALLRAYGYGALGEALNRAFCEALIDLGARSVRVLWQRGACCDLRSIPEVREAVQDAWTWPQGLERQIVACQRGVLIPTWPVLIQRELHLDYTGWTNTIAGEPGALHDVRPAKRDAQGVQGIPELSRSRRHRRWASLSGLNGGSKEGNGTSLRSSNEAALQKQGGNMKRSNLTLPEIGLIVGTRAMLGAGVALLLADRLSKEQRKAVGWTLFLFGAISTVPLVVEVFGNRR